MSLSNENIFPQRPTPPNDSHIKAGIEACLVVQSRALSQGKRPFAAVLVAPDNTTVLLTHQSVDHVNHAESSLARLAANHYTQDYLWKCTLYSTWEPCAMCVGTIYWANIGRLVFAAAETELIKLTGQGNEENYTMNWPCREILKGGQKDIEVWGPLKFLDTVVKEESDRYWKKVREGNANAEK